ncbi:hypothetical protein HELRODRAFT_85810 [Helobdella robusta]|uniref:PDZ domain-containing protein n=1 Tax=Helobdella robusta TaxID=6412 RepID=T1G629_HELRO|nr:hypothetical protein HELRODRAFT_85810 [Helobdella robusta]ESN97268.1 hypothetical protein HELRODRAFT_85810 [Helobdella robusta]
MASNNNNNNNNSNINNNDDSKPKLNFHCQLAQGSPTGIISGFTNVKELYQKIAACYDIKPSEILFCTLNTHKIDMARLLGGQLGLEDFIFAHVKGRPKVVDVEKSEEALGLTITDNGAGLAFIKAIKEGSVMSKIDGLIVGDHIEKINNVSVVGSRHFEVAKMLKEIPVNSTFSLRVVEPEKSDFGSPVTSKNQKTSKGGSMGTGKETLRLRPKGAATLEIADDVSSVAVDKINAMLEGFLGISDAELSQTIWELGSKSNNPSEFVTIIRDSDLSMFGFTEVFIFELWGAISDAKQGRLKKIKEVDEKF